MANEIPEWSRKALLVRDLNRCVRCGGMGSAWHHRRRRRVQDSHTHEPCNGVTLCVVCHSWVHANPRLSTEQGWIVSAWNLPINNPVLTFAYGWAFLNCDGTLVLAGECEECETIAVLEKGLCLDCLITEVGARNPMVVRLRERMTT